ncbi:hypothetical protein ABZ801_40200 [Actinomadura sp. NPDC047616]|uniref:MarR family winged helix-turn-helix transcriptional regulator n=1 Tax=Actinomadura sp. NPDC047616 TaxID=3155914 RepID=UPI0033DD1CD6
MTGAELAERAGVPPERGRPCVDRLVDAGYVARADGVLTITPEGRAAAGRLVEARLEGLARHLAGWSPQDHPELTGLLSRLAAESLGDEADGKVVYHGERPLAAS